LCEELVNFRPQGHVDEDHEELIGIQGQFLLVYLGHSLPEEVDCLDNVLACLCDATHLVYRAIVVSDFPEVLNRKDIRLGSKLGVDELPGYDCLARQEERA